MIGLKHVRYLCLYIITSFLLTMVLIAGNDYIAGLTDYIFEGKELEFTELLFH